MSKAIPANIIRAWGWENGPLPMAQLGALLPWAFHKGQPMHTYLSIFMISVSYLSNGCHGCLSKAFRGRPQQGPQQRQQQQQQPGPRPRPAAGGSILDRLFGRRVGAGRAKSSSSGKSSKSTGKDVMRINSPGQRFTATHGIKMTKGEKKQMV